jgi:hypothetical protein
MASRLNLAFTASAPGLNTQPNSGQMTLRFANNLIRLVAIVGMLLALSPSALGGQRFTDNGDGTVTDHRLGVMWAKSDNQGDIGWKQAEAFARYSFGLTVGKQYTNWRLPTLEELQSLYVVKPDYSGYGTDCGVQVKIVSQIKLSCILVWSSDLALGSPMAFNFNIGNPFTVQSYDISGCRVLPVRSLE